MDKLQLMVEAERRGILPADKAALLNEARNRGLLKSLEGGQTTPVDTRPQWGKENPNLFSMAQGARDVLGPVVEFGGAALGGLAGVAAGTVASPTLVINPVTGGAAGAGLGYGIAKELTGFADEALGNVKPRTLSQRIQDAALNVAEGAASEVGGQVLGKYVIAPAVKGIGKGIGKVADIGKLSKVKASEMVRQALGPDLPVVQNMLASAPGGVTAGQAVADITSPTFQALMDRAVKRDPRFLMNLQQTQGDESLNALRSLVGGADQTAAITAQQEARNALNATLEPIKNAALTRVNMGKDVTRFDKQGAQMGQKAAESVDTVRRMVPLAERTKASPTYKPEGQPKVPSQYTYKGELANRAEDVATKAASKSLDEGTIARSNENVAKTLRDRGINPINTDQITKSLTAKLNDPKLAANPEMETSVNIVTKEVNKWKAKGGGVIDAEALDAIRKNSINAISAKLNPNADATVQKRIASSVLGNIKPLLVDAIEQAGGKGYREYLKAYETGAQAISQKKLSAEALDMFQKNPQGFVDLVKGNSPDKVEKIFGPGSYDIAKEMSEGAMGTLKKVAGTIERDAKIAKQVTAGQDALRELLIDNSSKLRFPNVLNIFASTANRGLDEIERRVSKRTMNLLTEGAKSAKSLDDLLKTIPAKERSALLKYLNNPRLPAGTKGATLNALTPESDNRNELTK